MTHLEKFQASDFWKSHDPFTLREVEWKLQMPRSVVLDIVNRLADEMTRGTKPDGRAVYQRIKAYRECLHRKMASDPEFVYGSREWV